MLVRVYGRFCGHVAHLVQTVREGTFIDETDADNVSVTSLCCVILINK